MVPTIPYDYSLATIYSPLPSRPNQGSDDPSALDPTLLSGLEILVIEDTPENQFMFRVFLELYGAHVSVQEGGREGINQALSADFDVILCDIQMPEVDGFEVVKVLRTEGVTAPIIAITAYASQEARDKAMASGFDGFLTKPIQRANLVQAIYDARFR